MGKREMKSTSHEMARNLDLVKAAAHAWFEHGSAGRKQMSAFDTSSEDLCASYKASRFKMEAAAAAASSGINSSRHGRYVKTYSLLDEYEVESIVRNLEQVVLLDGSRRAREFAGYSDGNELRKERESKKQTGTKWIKRGFACPTNMNDVAAAAVRRKSTSGLNPPLRQSNFKFHVLL